MILPPHYLRVLLNCEDVWKTAAEIAGTSAGVLYWSAIGALRSMRHQGLVDYREPAASGLSCGEWAITEKGDQELGRA